LTIARSQGSIIWDQMVDVGLKKGIDNPIEYQI
jgi:hypothetical protein